MPERNPTENLWHYMRSHDLSNWAYDTYDDLLNAGTAAYRRLTPDIIKTVCACPYMEKRAE